MFIKNDTGSVSDTKILDDNDEELYGVHKAEWSHEANSLPVATFHCHKPMIASKINGRILWDLKGYTRQQKESLYAELGRQLND